MKLFLPFWSGEIRQHKRSSFSISIFMWPFNIVAQKHRTFLARFLCLPMSLIPGCTRQCNQFGTSLYRFLRRVDFKGCSRESVGSDCNLVRSHLPIDRRRHLTPCSQSSDLKALPPYQNEPQLSAICLLLHKLLPVAFH